MHLLAADDQKDHVARLVGKHALALEIGGSALQIVDDELLDLLVVVADDEEQLVVRSSVQQVGHHPRRDVDRQQRIERQHPAVRRGLARSESEADHGQTRQHDKSVGQKDARRELDPGKFLQQHADDVRTPRGGLLPHDNALPHTDGHGPDDAGQQQIVRQIEASAQHQRRIKRFDRLGRRIDQPREDVHEARRVERRQHRPRAEPAAENQHRRNHQRNVEHVAEGSHLNRRENVVKHDTHTVDTARHEVVRVDEQHETRAHDRAAQKNQEPRTPPRPRSHRFE